MAHDRFDIVIAGAGIPGLALGCALADALGPPMRIALLDRGLRAVQPNSPDVRASALSAGSKRLLEAITAWEPLAQHAQPICEIAITDSSLQDAIRPVLVTYDNRVEGGAAATYVVENARVRAALVAAAGARPALSLLYGRSARDLSRDEHGVTVELDDGQSLRASLLVAAEGRSSPLREAAGIRIVRWQYPQIGIVTTVQHEKPHGGRAVQHFLPAGPFAILPLTGNRACITWTEEEKRAREILALGDNEFLVEVEKRFDFRLGSIALAGPRGSWPLDMHLARSFAADRFVLVGDAAHGVHPIAGQGLNLGLRDVAALAEVLADAARLGLDIGSVAVLERYERWRRLDSALSAATFDALNRLFSNDWTVLRTARDFGLGLVERAPVLKQFFVAEGAGLTGEVPKLLRGEPA